jgi:hypothetical protein
MKVKETNGNIIETNLRSGAFILEYQKQNRSGKWCIRDAKDKTNYDELIINIMPGQPKTTWNEPTGGENEQG